VTFFGNSRRNPLLFSSDPRRDPVSFLFRNWYCLFVPAVLPFPPPRFPGFLRIFCIFLFPFFFFRKNASLPPPPPGASSPPLTSFRHARPTFPHPVDNALLFFWPGDLTPISFSCQSDSFRTFAHTVSTVSSPPFLLMVAAVAFLPSYLSAENLHLFFSRVVFFSFNGT